MSKGIRFSLIDAKNYPVLYLETPEFDLARTDWNHPVNDALEAIEARYLNRLLALQEDIRREYSQVLQDIAENKEVMIEPIELVPGADRLYYS